MFATSVMFVACYKEKTGELLWEREFAISGIRIVFNAFSIHLSGGALVVAINDPFSATPRVLLFDARDGS
jgi:outer membrane protein assembly factor BamB